MFYQLINLISVYIISTRNKVGIWSDLPIVILFDQFSRKSKKVLKHNTDWEWESACCVCQCVCVCVCVCVLDREASWVFASTALDPYSYGWLCIWPVTAIYYLTGFHKPLLPPHWVIEMPHWFVKCLVRSLPHWLVVSLFSHCCWTISAAGLATFLIN